MAKIEVTTIEEALGNNNEFVSIESPSDLSYILNNIFFANDGKVLIITAPDEAVIIQTQPISG